MAITKNTALRNLQAQALGDAFDGGTIQIRTGAKPASANSAASGSLLSTINLPDPAFAPAASGAIDKAGTSWSAIASGTGTAGYARFISSDTLKVMDCTVAESAADLIIDDDAITSGGIVTVTAMTLNIPSGE